MSLVNKVIHDLEERQAITLKDETRIFRGLSSTDSVESRVEFLRTPFVVALFLLASVSATYAIMDRSAEKVISEMEGLDENAITKVSNGHSRVGPAGTIDGVDVINAQASGQEKLASESRQALKLDFSLPRYDDELKEVDETVEFATGGAGLHWIGLHRQNKGIALQLGLTRESDYRAYSLSNPNRVVIELEETQFTGTLPDISAYPALKKVRLRRESNGKLILVFDAYQAIEVNIAHEGMNDEGFGLELVLDTGESMPQQEPEQIVVIPDPVPGDKDMPAAVASSHYGEININLNRDSSHDRFERMLQDARDFYRLGKVIEGNELLAIILREKPEHNAARILLAKKLISQGQLHKVDRLLKEVVDSDAWNPELADLYARVMVNRGDITSAILVLEEMKPELKSNPEYYAFLAALYQKNRQHENAVINYRKVVQVKPSNGVWWMGLAISLEAQGKNNDAIFAYNRSLAGRQMTQDLQKYVQGKIGYLKKRDRG